MSSLFDSARYNQTNFQFEEKNISYVKPMRNQATFKLYGFYFQHLGQTNGSGSNSWSSKTLLGAASDVAALTLALLSGIKFFLSYQTVFQYDMSRLKRFMSAPNNVHRAYGTKRDENSGSDGDAPRYDYVQAMKDSMIKRSFIQQSYWSYWWTNLWSRYLCCCLVERYRRKYQCCDRRLKRVKFVDTAHAKLAKELDMEKIVSTIRIGKFLSQMQLSRHQRLAVDFFLRYEVQMKDITGAKVLRGASKESIVISLKPEDNSVDRRILFELTGLKFEEGDYADEQEISDEEKEDDEATNSYQKFAALAFLNESRAQAPKRAV